MNFRKVALLVTVLMFASVAAFANSTLYTQVFNPAGNLYASQNDSNGFGQFAQVYDNFKINSASNVWEIQFTGGYFNPPNQGPITNWFVGFYADAGGQPGALLASGNWANTGGETFLGNYNGFPIYTYDINFSNPFAAAAGTQYWVSVVPTLGFQPQWGWSSATGGDGVSYQDFFGTRSQLGADMAFTLLGQGQGGVPEPGTLIMLGTGVLGLAGTLRRKLF